MTVATPVYDRIVDLKDYGSVIWPASQLMGLRGATAIVIGDSITDLIMQTVGGLDSPQCTGYWTWANAKLDQRWNLLAEKGIFGQTTTQILARFSADVLNFSPKPAVVVIQGGGNDITNSVNNAAAIIANLQSMYQQAIAAGIFVIATTVMPSVNMNTAQMKADYFTVVNWQKSYCYGRAGIALCDWSRHFLDAGGFSITPLTTQDGVHPNGYGAQLMGEDLAEILDWLAPPIDRLGASTDADLGNLLAVGNFQGSGGTHASGGSGTLAASWTTAWDTTSGTYVASKAARSDIYNGVWQQFQLTAPGNLQIKRSVNGALYSAGDLLQAAVAFELDGDVSGIQRASLQLVCDDANGSLRTVSDCSGSVFGSTGAQLKSFAGRQRTPVYTLGGSPTAVRFIFSFYGVAGGGASGTGTLRLSQAEIRKVG